MTNILRPILLVLFTCLLLLQVVVCIGGARMGSAGRSDFRQLYTAGYMVRSGHASQIYDYDEEASFQDMVVGPGYSFPFDHLAYEALLFVPFSFLRFRIAYFIFFALNLILLASAAWMFKPYVAELAPFGSSMPYLILFCFLPVAITLILGQDSILLLTLMIAALVSFDHGLEFRSGIFIGLGLFKFQYVIPIALLFLIWRRYRVISGVFLCSSVLGALSVWIAGLAATRTLGRTLFVMSTGLSSNAARMKYVTFPDHMPNLRGLIYALAQHFSVAQGRVAVLAAIGSALVVVLAARMKPSFSLAVTVAALLSYHGLIHDASLLIIPIGLILAWSIPKGNIGVTVIALTVFIVPAIVFLFYHGLYFVMTIPILALMWAHRFVADTVS